MIGVVWYFCVYFLFFLINDVNCDKVDDCLWAQRYNNFTQLSINTTMQEEVMMLMVKSDGKFAIPDYAYNSTTGFVSDGCLIDYTTGLKHKGVTIYYISYHK
jgi:hypothetical protein